VAPNPGTRGHAENAVLGGGTDRRLGPPADITAQKPIVLSDANGAGVIFSVPHILIFSVLWLAVQYAWVMLVQPGVLAGAQIDTDGYMRLVRVGLLLETGNWFDGMIPRSNWPFGESHHWTRPLDVLILGLALPARLFMQWPEAIAVAGALVSPLCHLALCIAAVWVVAPLVPGEERFLAMPVVLAQPGLLAYGTAGRADHHALIFLLFALALGAWIRVLLAPTHARAAYITGALSAAGIWVSPESLLPLALLFLSGGLAWVLHGAPLDRANRRLCLGLLGGLAAALIIEKPPGQWLVPTYDQISIAHLTMAAAALGCWQAMIRLQPAIGAQTHRTARRLAAGLAGGAAAVLLVALVYPSFFRGPWVDVDPAVVSLWLRHVSELQPLLPATLAEAGTFIRHLGPSLILGPAVLIWILREPDEGRRRVFLLLGLSLTAYVPLAAAQARFSGYAGVVFALLTVELLRRIFSRAARLPAPRDSLVRVASMAALTIGFFTAGLAVSAVAHATGAEPADESRTARQAACPLPTLGEWLADPSGAGARPRPIAAFIDFGPELLYRTPHPILSGPYHRNAGGILDAHRIMTGTDEAAVRELLDARHVELLLICPPRDEFYFGTGGGGSLYRRLLSGEAPAWTRRVALPPGAGSFQLFEVVN
jgi:hypothetical protein